MIKKSNNNTQQTDRSSLSTAGFREPKSECLSGKRQRVTTGKKRIIVKKIVHDTSLTQL